MIKSLKDYEKELIEILKDHIQKDGEDIKVIKELIKKNEDKITSFADMLSNHMKQEGDEITDIKETLYGNKEKGLIGMNEKVDDMHTFLIQSRTIKPFLGYVLLVLGVLAALKGWFGIK